MTDKTLREEIANIISRPGAFYILNGGAPFWYNESFEERTDAILALFRQEVKEAKPIELVYGEPFTYSKEQVQSYNNGVSDYHDALKEKMK